MPLIDAVRQETGAPCAGRFDSELMAAYLDWSGEMARLGLLDCEMPREDETVEAWMRQKMAHGGSD